VERYAGEAGRGSRNSGSPLWEQASFWGIPAEAQPPVSFSGQLIFYPHSSPVLAQKIWTLPDGAGKI